MDCLQPSHHSTLLDLQSLTIEEAYGAASKELKKACLGLHKWLLYFPGHPIYATVVEDCIQDVKYWRQEHFEYSNKYLVPIMDKEDQKDLFRLHEDMYKSIAKEAAFLLSEAKHVLQVTYENSASCHCHVIELR